MPAHTLTGETEALSVTLYNSAVEIIKTQMAADSVDAVRVAVMLVARRDRLEHGDTLAIRRPSN